MKITTYNVPFEQTSRDRIVQPALLDPFKVQDSPDTDFSYNIATSTSATITITGLKTNYIKVDESAEKAEDRILRTPITYWFATVKTIESSEAITYECKLDVVLTYFNSHVVNQIDGVPVNVQRFHEERYKIEGNDIVIDPEFIATKSGEFQIANKDTNRIIYSPSEYKYWTWDKKYIDTHLPDVVDNTPYVGDDLSSGNGFWMYRDEKLNKGETIAPPPEDPATITMVNTWIKIKDSKGIIRVSKLLRIYREFETIDGFPFTYSAAQGDITYTGDEPITIGLYTESKNFRGNESEEYKGYIKTNYRLGNTYQDEEQPTVLWLDSNRKIQSTKSRIDNRIEINGNEYYTYAIIKNSIITFDLEAPVSNFTGSAITIAPIDIYNKSSINNIKEFSKLPDGSVINIFLSPFKLNYLSRYYKEQPVVDVSNVHEYDLLYYKGFGHPLDVVNDIQVYYGFFDNNQIHQILSVMKTSLSHKELALYFKVPKADFAKLDEWDVALLPNLNIEQHISSSKQTLDLSNYDFANDKQDISLLVNEMGLNYKVFNNIYKYSLFTENNYLTFFTDQASSYLETHKGQIEMQKKRIDLETDLAIKGVQSSQTSNFGGGIIGAGMAALNPASYVNLSLLGDTKQINRDLAQNKKDTIQAQINDLKNTPAIMNMGNEHTLNILQPAGTDGVGSFYTKIEIPNKALLSKMNNYLKRYGYKYDGYLNFTSLVWKTRETFNFISIKDIRDELRADNYLDDSAIEIMDKEFEQGIRVWHKDIADYSKRNLEKKLIV